MRLLLLGNKGQVGGELGRILPGLGHLIATDYPDIDLADGVQLRNLVRDVRPDVIVNAAAYTDVDRAESQPELAFAVNGVAPGILAEEARKTGAAFIHYSTDYVFDGNKDSPYTEEDRPNPLNVYGKSKLMGDQAIGQVGGSYLILRTSWVYGLYKDSFVTRFLSWIRQKPQVRIVADQVGSPTWCRTLAECTAQILSMLAVNGRDWLVEHRGVYHLAGSGFASRFDLARKILEYLPEGYPVVAQSILPARTAEFNDPARRPIFSALDVGHFVHTFGMEIPAWERSLRLALADYFSTGDLPHA